MTTTTSYETINTGQGGLLPRWLTDVVANDRAIPVAGAGAIASTGRQRPDHNVILQAYQAHHHDLLRFATLVAPEDCQPEDLVQDAFVQLYRSWAKVEDVDRLGGYLRVTILNGARGRGRKLGVARRHRQEPQSDMASAEVHALDRLGGDEVVAALQCLARRQRECLVLRYFEGYSESEIASALGIAVGSARTHLHRGTKALKNALGAQS